MMPHRRRDGAKGKTHRSYQEQGPPRSACWGCISPSVCQFRERCPVFAAYAADPHPEAAAVAR